MSRLLDMRNEIDRIVQDRGLDLFSIRGKIALRAGFALGFISEDTPDDGEKIQKLREAVRQILEVEM